MNADPNADPNTDPDGSEPDLVLIQPPGRNTLLAALLAGLLVVAAVLADTGGRLLAVPVVALAVGFIVRDRVGGPLLRADDRGIELLAGWRRVGSAWAGVDRIRAVKDRRTPVLEVDFGHTVVALSGTRLGRHPADIVEDLDQLRARGSR